MYKTQMVEIMATQAGISKEQAKLALHAYMDSVKTTLVKGGAVTLFGFGTFKVQHRSERKQYNIRTSHLMMVPASKNAKFTAGKAFKNALNY